MAGNRILKGCLGLAAGLLVTAIAMAPALTEAAQDRNCDNNAMMFCGAFTKAEFDRKLNNGDGRNTAGNLHQVFMGEGHMSSQAAFDSGDTVTGTVFKDGRVVVNGRVVATNAVSDGRVKKSGSVRSGTMWETPTQTSFLSDSIPAFVNMSGGTMHWFVLMSCGNTGHGRPVAPSKSPTPTPSMTPVPTAKPQKTVIIIKQQQQQQQQQQAVPAPVQTTVIEQQQQQQPQVLSATTAAPLPATGPETMLGGAAGLAAIGYAGRAYLRSKRSLLDAMRKGKSSE